MIHQSMLVMSERNYLTASKTSKKLRKKKDYRFQRELNAFNRHYNLIKHVSCT